MKTSSFISVLMLVSILIPAASAFAADPVIKITEVKDEDGNVIEKQKITFTDNDGDGKYDKTVYEIRNKNDELISRTTDTDTNNDGKSETSVTENFADPTKQNPSEKITRTRSQNDSGWNEVVEEHDNNQNGVIDKKITATASRKDSKFDILETKTDADEDGKFESTERLVDSETVGKYDLKFTGPGAPEKGKFGNIREAVDTPKMLSPGSQPGKAEGSGKVSVPTDGSGVSFSGTLINGLGSIYDPLIDPALMARISIDGEYITLSDDEQNVFLKGKIPYLEYITNPTDTGFTDPAAEIALLGFFDLSTLRLAGVSNSSPYYDLNLTALDSLFILAIDELLRSFPNQSSLLLRFDAYDDIRNTDGSFTLGAESFAIMNLEVTVSEPNILMLIALIFIGAILTRFSKISPRR